MLDKESYQYIIVKGYIHKLPIKKEIPTIEHKTTEENIHEKEDPE